MKYRIILISIIHRRNFEEILMIKRKREPHTGKWALPGGFGALENEKDPFKAIKDEVYADLGVKYNSKFFTLQYKEEDKPTICLYFIGKIIGNPKIRKDSKSIEEFKWIPVDEIFNLNLAFEDEVKQIINKIKE
ncbi:MAG: NUDIX hydrolase [archaeon]